jgi:hypothetical protein
VQFEDLAIASFPVPAAYHIVQAFPVLVSIGDKILIGMMNNREINDVHGIDSFSEHNFLYSKHIMLRPFVNQRWLTEGRGRGGVEAGNEIFAQRRKAKIKNHLPRRREGREGHQEKMKLRSVSLRMSFPLVGNRRLFKLQCSEPIPDKPRRNRGRPAESRFAGNDV